MSPPSDLIDSDREGGASFPTQPHDMEQRRSYASAHSAHSSKQQQGMRRSSSRLSRELNSDSRPNGTTGALLEGGGQQGVEEEQGDREGEVPSYSSSDLMPEDEAGAFEGGVGPDEVAQRSDSAQLEAEARKLDSRMENTSRISGGLPSPPLTHASSNESGLRERSLGDGDALEGADEDPHREIVPDWHPLAHSPIEFEYMKDEEQDVGAGDTGNVGDSFSPDKEKNAKRRATPQFKLDLKPPSPNPWDIVDPPSSHGHDPDFYSTLTSKPNGTLMRKPRPPIPRSSYYVGPPPPDSAYGTEPIGRIGLHHPREIIRIERDYCGGELPQFASTYPLELEGRITPTEFLHMINTINEILISAHNLRYSFIDNLLSILTFQLYSLIVPSHYDKEMQRLQRTIEQINVDIYNPVGLNILWPRKVALLFLEIEYY